MARAYFDHRFEAYAHYGKAGEVMSTGRVDIRLRPSPHGNYLAKVHGAWRRVRKDWDTNEAYCMLSGERVRIIIHRNDA